MSENTNKYSTKHPHEPEIPATYDDEGRCLICGLLVQITLLEDENATLKRDMTSLVERAERVQEGEDWDLAEFILRKVNP